MADQSVSDLQLSLQGSEPPAALRAVFGGENARHQASEEVGGAGDPNTVFGIIWELSGDRDLKASSLVGGHVLIRHPPHLSSVTKSPASSHYTGSRVPMAHSDSVYFGVRVIPTEGET